MQKGFLATCLVLGVVLAVRSDSADAPEPGPIRPLYTALKLTATRLDRLFERLLETKSDEVSYQRRLAVGELVRDTVLFAMETQPLVEALKRTSEQNPAKQEQISQDTARWFSRTLML